MVTGVLFLNPKNEISIKKLLQKYILRIILAIFIFGVPFAFMEIFFNENYQFKFYQIEHAIINVFQGKLWAHMWYLYMIAGLYFIMPLLKTFVKYADKILIEYIMLVLFIFSSIIPVIDNIFSIKIGFYVPVTSICVFYLFLGHFIHYYKFELDNKIILVISILYIIFCLLAPIIGIEHPNGLLAKYATIDNPIVIMISVSIFCFIRQNENNENNKVFEFLSPLCFGIYLIHQLFLNILYKYFHITPEKYPLTMVIIVTSLLTMILSLIFSFYARKIEIIKKYLL
jgi:surface polysaccharide O-acyltransferase-like enzyme